MKGKLDIVDLHEWKIIQKSRDICSQSELAQRLKSSLHPCVHSGDAVFRLRAV